MHLPIFPLASVLLGERYICIHRPAGPRLKRSGLPDNTVFSYGISDHEVEGLNGKTASGVDLQKPDGKVTLVQPSALMKNAPQPFKSEPTGGGGTRMHHKFVVIDFDLPTARVYMGSYNFSSAADLKNGENLLLIRDQRVAVSYVVEAIRIFDHYHFRVAQAEAKEARKKLQLAPPHERLVKNLGGMRTTRTHEKFEIVNCSPDRCVNGRTHDQRLDHLHHSYIFCLARRWTSRMTSERGVSGEISAGRLPTPSRIFVTFHFE